MELYRTAVYQRSLKRLGASATDIDALETHVVSSPNAGDVVPGLKGIRKIRFAMAGKGKGGGGRALYFVVRASAIYTLVAYSKSDQSDLTPEQRKIFLAMLKDLEA
jgi:hypothetical protein